MDISETIEAFAGLKKLGVANAKHNNIFDWYELVCKQGDFELEVSLKRFYENCKLHLFIFGGVFAIWAYALKNQIWLLVASVLFESVAIIHARSWKDQILSSSWWEAHWRKAAGMIEVTDSFKMHVGVKNEEIKVWAFPKIIDTDPELRKNSPSQKMLLKFVDSLIFIYFVMMFSAIGLLIAYQFGFSL